VIDELDLELYARAAANPIDWESLNTWRTRIERFFDGNPAGPRLIVSNRGGTDWLAVHRPVDGRAVMGLNVERPIGYIEELGVVRNPWAPSELVPVRMRIAAEASRADLEQLDAGELSARRFYYFVTMD
jgi:hypothetical protein